MSGSLYDAVRARYAPPESFVTRLRARMEEHGVTQADLARRSGLQESHVSRWLRGHVTPQLRTMLVLDETMDLLVEEAP